MPEAKSAQMLMAIRDIGAPGWTRRSFPALAQEGFMRNPVVHRCVRLIAEAATDPSARERYREVHERRRRLEQGP